MDIKNSIFNAKTEVGLSNYIKPWLSKQVAAGDCGWFSILTQLLEKKVRKFKSTKNNKNYKTLTEAGKYFNKRNFSDTILLDYVITNKIIITTEMYWPNAGQH